MVAITDHPIIRCLFCKIDSSKSRSVEHIIPESLGNSRRILPRGVVCDSCNNYFSRKVEGPFLNSPAVKTLRFHQCVENKRGRVPSLEGVITPGFAARVTYMPRIDLTSIAVSAEALRAISRESRIRLMVPFTGPSPSDVITGRFFAKVALEAMAERLTTFPEGLSYLCDEPQLDPIRRYARYGDQFTWPVHVRTIYGADASLLDENGKRIQIIHESDFLVTPESEWYFVVAIFGVEFSINIGDPSIDGYIEWLARNRGLSPLYSGRNSDMGEIPS